ncbi:TPA: hypothetical protein I8Y21_003640 [Klebsiella oxytoca]|uniref:Uncharacterized protein n=1 Tax=Klebsiella oxytoca TaxID=571 RepID=A0AAN5LAI0_KLEOX|nr:hypothetical protein [Klebsiella oxytoca]
MMQRTDLYPNSGALWSLGELRYLEKHYRTTEAAEIAAHLGRTPGAVRLMADRLGCRRKRGGGWTEAEKEIIRCHYTREGAEGLMVRLPGRSINAIFRMAEKMGVPGGRFWREEEIQLLKALYPVKGSAVAEQLPGRSVVAVNIMARRLGLKKWRGSESGFRPWGPEEWTLLENNMHLSVREQQRTLFPDRTLRAVEKARGRLIRRRRTGCATKQRL